MVRFVSIAGRKVGPGQPCFVVAEAGVNHNGDLNLARRLIDVAVEAGADAVKFQTFKAERLVTPDAPKANYQIATTDAAETQFAMLKRLELSEDMHRSLQAYCNQRGIIFMSTPFDETSTDLLETLDLPVFKVPSGEITNLPFLVHIARKGRPMILSTGMASMDEVTSAVSAIRGAGNKHLVVLHCVSNYPADPKDANLRAMDTLARSCKTPIGFSDHTLGIEVAIAAVARGACVIEKHFTLDRSLPGPDHKASLEPAELIALVKGIRTVEAALGHGRKEPVLSESETAKVARKSLVAVRDLAAGIALTPDMLTAKRPGTGIPPSMIQALTGRTLLKPVSEGTLLRMDMLA